MVSLSVTFTIPVAEDGDTARKKDKGMNCGLSNVEHVINELKQQLQFNQLAMLLLIPLSIAHYIIWTDHFAKLLVHT